MADNFDVGTEAKEDRTFCVAGLRLPLCPLFPREGAARAFMLRPIPNDVILSSYPRCDSLCVDSMLWKLLYTDLRRPPYDAVIDRFLPCLEMATGGDVSYAHEHATRRKLPRLFKTYFPFRLIPFYRQARYIYVIRSPWEACEAYYDFLASTDALDTSFDAFFEDFLEGDVTYGSYFRHVAPWIKRIGESNILILCREHVEHNPRTALFKIAAFLGDQYLRLLMDNDELEKDILGDFSDFPKSFYTAGRVPNHPSPDYELPLQDRDCIGLRASKSPVCNERQLNAIMQKVSQHFGNSSLEFLWTNLFQKQLSILVG